MAASDCNESVRSGGVFVGGGRLGGICVFVSAVVSGEVGDGGEISFGLSSSAAGVNVVVHFCMPAKSFGAAYSCGGRGEKGIWRKW